MRRSIEQARRPRHEERSLACRRDRVGRTTSPQDMERTMTLSMQQDAQGGGTPTLHRFPLTAANVSLGDTLVGAAALLEREDKLTRTGKPMAQLSFRNATGAASMPVWAEQLPAIASLRSGIPVMLTATWAPGRGGTAEWRFESAEVLPLDHVVMLEAQPFAPVTLVELGTRMTTLLAVLSAEARALFDVLMNTPLSWGDGVLESMKSRYVQAPAATANHHATVRGLFHHSVQVAALAHSTATVLRDTGDAPDVDFDAVILGSLFHDVGKLDELSWRGAFKYTARAAVMTHMGWGLCRLTEAVTRAETTAEWRPTLRQRELIEHTLMIVSSHHAQKEWGALVEPASREAWIVATADQLSAKVQPITDTAGTGTPLAEGWTRVGTGKFARSQFISPTAARSAGSTNNDHGVLRLALSSESTEVTDAA